MHDFLLSFYLIAAVPVNFVQKSVFFSKSKHEIGLCMPIPMKIFFSRSRIQFTPYISTPKRVWLIWSYVMPDGNQVYKRCKYIYWLHFIFHFRKKKKVFAKISYICWSKTCAGFDIDWRVNMDRYLELACRNSSVMLLQKVFDHDETRTRNLLIRSQTPYPLGHAVIAIQVRAK